MVSSDGDAFNRGVNDLSMCYSQDMCYRCHRPGNASDRARMKTFSFRLGDLDGDGFV